MTRTPPMIRVMFIDQLRAEDTRLPIVSTMDDQLIDGQSHMIFTSFAVDIDQNPDTSVLDKSDLNLIMRSQLGLSSQSSKAMSSIPKLLLNREIGVNYEGKRHPTHTSSGSVDRCRLSDNYLPNKMWTIEQYPSKGLASAVL